MSEQNNSFTPKSDFRPESFEGLLGSFYLTLKPLEISADIRDQQDFQRAVGILNDFAAKYGVRKPEDVVKNPRGNYDYELPSATGNNWRTLDLIRAFWADHAIAWEEGEDLEEVRDLQGVILNVFERKGFVKVAYDSRNKEFPSTFKDWRNGHRNTTLYDIIGA